MEIKTTENATERRGFIKRPENTTVIIRAGYSVICDIRDRIGVVLKVPLPFEEYEQAMEIEKRVYRRLGKHPNLPNVVDVDEYGIYLERADPGCLRLYYNEGGNATPEERIKWCRDVAEVLYYVHQKNIRHADLSGRNLLIDLTRNILLCDFAGSSIDDDLAIVVAETGFRHPDEREYRSPTIRAEIHALWSTIYEIVPGRKPFHKKKEEQEREVEKLMKEGQYPNVNELPLGDVIFNCWKREGYFNSAAEVAEEITRSTPKYVAQIWPSLPFERDSSSYSSAKDLSNHSSSKASPSISSDKDPSIRLFGQIESMAN